MKHSITLNRDYYSRYPDFIKWCEVNVGDGSWGAYDEIPPGLDWIVHETFGYVTYSFRDEKTLNNFRKSNDLLSISTVS
jgi:hypothetical protein